MEDFIFCAVYAPFITWVKTVVTVTFKKYFLVDLSFSKVRWSTPVRPWTLSFNFMMYEYFLNLTSQVQMKLNEDLMELPFSLNINNIVLNVAKRKLYSSKLNTKFWIRK